MFIHSLHDIRFKSLPLQVYQACYSIMHRYAAFIAAALTTRAAAHGFVDTFTLDGTPFEGYERWANGRDPKHIGWSFTTEDEGPELDLTSPNFACRRDAKIAPAYGTIAAGGDVDILWTSADKVTNPHGWAESHHGPMFLYLAPCNGECATVDKTQLKWTKIAESGVVSGPANTQGIWATDVMRQNGGHSKYKLPASIKAGNYVLRSEIIALHKAHEGIPEFYMQCANVKVTGAGTDDLSGSGVVASQLYSKSDAIFGFDLYNNRKTQWANPGPKVYAAAAAAPPPALTTTSAPGLTSTSSLIPTTLATLTTTGSTSTTIAPAETSSEAALPPSSTAGPSDSSTSRVRRPRPTKKPCPFHS